VVFSVKGSTYINSKGKEKMCRT